MGGRRLGSGGRTAAADAAATVVLVLSFIGSSGMTAMHRLNLTEHLRIVYVVFPPLRAPCAGNAIQISQFNTQWKHGSTLSTTWPVER